MALKTKTTIDSLDEMCAKILADEYRRTLAYLGEKYVRRIKDRPSSESWNDITTNLRSSIGYMLVEEGRKIMQSTFRASQAKGSSLGGNSDGASGVSAGQRYIDELADKYADTFVLVVVAGMNYADYVESHKNKDVLASTELLARKEIGSYLEKANQKVARRINRLSL